MKNNIVSWENGGCLTTPLASIWITGACPLRCKHCYESLNAGNRAHVSFGILKTIIDLIGPHVNSISFMGGEPTLHPRIVELCAYAKSLGKYVLLVSNGINITKELVAQLKGNIDCVKLGMDGVCEKTHDQIRGAGSFQKTLRAWQIMAPEIPTMCKFTLNSKNISEIEKIAPFYQNLGAKRLVLNSWLKIGTGASIWNERFALSEAQRKLANDFVVDVLKPHYSEFPVSRSCSLDEGCNLLPERTYYIDSKQKVSPCIFSGHLGIGNILTDNVSFLLSQVNQMRNAKKSLHYAKTPAVFEQFLLPEPQICIH